VQGRRKDGDLFPVQLALTVVRNDDGAPICIMGSGLDITDRKRAEEEIKSRNKQLVIINQIIGTATSTARLDGLLTTALEKTLELLDLSGGGIYLLEPDGRHATLKAYSGMSDELVGEVATLDATVPPHRTTFIDGRPHYGGMQAVAPKAQAIGISSLAVIPLVSGDRIVGALKIGSRNHHAFTEDEKKILEAIGKEIGGAIVKAMLQEELEAAWNETRLYLDIIAHDIRNANTISLGYLGLLAEAGDETTRDFAGRALTGIHKSMEIVRNASTIRKIYHDPLKQEHIDLDVVIREEIAGFPGARIRYDGCRCTVVADQLLPEIFTNLIGNAVKFGGPDVEVAIRVEEQPMSVMVTVEDTGPGIPDALKAKLFNRFSRGDSGKNGKGLGLYITRLLAERYGGGIRVEDRVTGHPGLGAAMTVTLQKVDNPVGTSAAQEA
jgi:signal transduction histidine kinase